MWRVLPGGAGGGGGVSGDGGGGGGVGVGVWWAGPGLSSTTPHHTSLPPSPLSAPPLAVLFYTYTNFPSTFWWVARTNKGAEATAALFTIYWRKRS